VIASIGSVGWLAWRNRQAQGSNYAGSLLQSIQEQGLGKVIADAVGTLAFYGSAFPGVLLPGMTSEQPFYAPMVVGALPTWNGGVLATAITLTVIALCGIGLWHERARGGIAGLLYVLLYCVCLAIWPWRHERFLWPLVPLIWAYVPAGCSLIGSLLPQRVRLSSALACGAAILGLCGWQSRADLSLISTNQRFLANRESFYRETAPGFYFSDWRQAGRWLNENSPPHARVLTWQAALGGTAHRYQRRVQFEAQSPEKVRQGIAAFPARYVVVTTAQFGLGFGWRQVYADPAYSFTVVYHDRDVAILEIGPNRSGEISRTGYDDWLQRQQHELDEFLARSPGRTDLIARKADLLQEQGDNAQAIAILQELVGNGVVTVRVCSSLGWLYFAEGQYDKAAYYLDLAKGLPNAEPVAESLADGARRARERLNAPAANTEDQAVERSLRKISAMVASLNLLNAEREADACLQRRPDHPELNYWRGYLHHLAGERDQAEAHYLRAAGSKPADEKLLLIRLERALAQTAAGPIKLEGSEESIEPNSFAAHVRLAKLYDEHGWSGRALATLEAAQQRFGNHPEIQSPLAELNLRFALTAEAAALYRQAQQAWPHDKSLRQGLAVAEAAQRIPTMVKAGRKSVTTNLANDHKK
jgi:Flp pilus assembly protein TadD